MRSNIHNACFCLNFVIVRHFKQKAASSSTLYFVSTPVSFSQWAWRPPLSWISPHTCMHKGSVSLCLCISPCIVWRGNVSPTYVHILEVSNLLGVNQNTCSECNLCQRFTLCLRWVSSCPALCFPTSVISVIWNQFNNCAWDGFKDANACMGKKNGVSNIKKKKKMRIQRGHGQRTCSGLLRHWKGAL